jgi:hypothetical protein
MRKLILKNDYSLGDVVLLTAAVRDLHRAYPNQLETDVRTGFPELWRHNPHLSRLDAYDSEVAVVSCDMPLVYRSNDVACHCLYGFIDFLNQHLGTEIKLTESRGDIHLSRREKAAPSPLVALTGAAVPFWLLSAGGRFDNTIKWWEARRYQEVVNHFRDRLLFVQVGHVRDYHPSLEGVIDLRGQTSVRDLVRLVYHAEGVLCGVTGLMHLAAAVPTRHGSAPQRPCVVVGGGRESPSWEAYPGHQFLHTVGALPCCATGGCWKSRSVRLGDGTIWDKPESLCVDAREGLPRCMDMIRSEEVIRAIETYLEGGMARPLRRPEAGRVRSGLTSAADNEPGRMPLNVFTARNASERWMASLPAYPGGFEGRGVVICAGGVRMFTNAWVCIHLLRQTGCELPIQVWYLGEEEMDAAMRDLLKPLGVECVDGLEVRRRHPVRQLHGWALKPYAILHCPFREVLLLDADNVALRNPEFLFESPPFRKTGAVFWPDFGRLAPDRTLWAVCGVRYRDEPEFETGQIVVDKLRCWDALNLAMWYNEHSDFYYQHMHGDKESFHMAFRKLGHPYSMPVRPIQPLPATMCQHDFDGQRLFQHRNLDKWTLVTRNRRIPGFRLEGACREALAQLAAKWDARLSVVYRPADRPRWTRRFRPRGHGPLRLVACLVSCRARDRMRAQTLRRLARTDWGEAPVEVVLDEERFSSRIERLCHTAWRALRVCLRTRADYVLYLEDDLDFNRFLRHNLETWPLLQAREIQFASLYNPCLRELAWDPGRQLTLAEAGSFYGTQAILLGRPLAEYLVEHWAEGPGALDMKWKAQLSQLKVPLLLHSPSLVQHRGRRSVWGGVWHWAPDYAPGWRSSRPVPRGRLEIKPVGGGSVA